MKPQAPPSSATRNIGGSKGQPYSLISDNELLEFVRYFPLQGGHVSVDAGCGSGGFCRQLHRFGYDVTGLDIAKSALTAARRTPLPGVRYVEHDLNVGDPPGLPYRGVDLVVCRLVLPFLDDPVAWVRRVRDVWLRPGGCVYAVIPIVANRGAEPVGLTEREVTAVTDGWPQVVRYRLNGSFAYLALRSPTALRPDTGRPGRDVDAWSGPAAPTRPRPTNKSNLMMGEPSGGRGKPCDTEFGCARAPQAACAHHQEAAQGHRT